ncbi:hypothetical protein ACWENS_28020 [Streptomyces sp. NPDC004532]
MRFLKSFGQFWYDFVIGDDWKIAVAVVLALAVLLAVLSLGLFDDATLAVVGGVLLVGAFSVSLAIDVRPTKS